MSKTILGGGAVLVGLLMVATQYFNWSGSLHYFWAVLVLIWGVAIFIKK